MKIGGVTLEGPSEEVLVLPRMGGDIIIKATAVLDMSDFEAMCPEPTAPKRLEKGGFKVDDKSPGYLTAVAEHGETRFAYICIKSLEDSEIEWETVDMEDPSTWQLWTKELSDAGMSSVEINRVVVCILGANSLDENKLTEARESFLAGQERQPRSSSGQGTEPSSTPSGEPVAG